LSSKSGPSPKSMKAVENNKSHEPLKYYLATYKETVYIEV